MSVKYDVAIIGGGPAGLSAASAAKQNGAKNVVLFEREKYLGGILNQCIHIGFGRDDYEEELTGPEYAKKLIERADGIDIYTDTYVLEVNNKHIVAVGHEKGLIEVDAKAVIIALGCREKPRGALDIAGSRPSGIFTAGTVQRFIKVYGKMCAKKAVIVGSFDLGLIMARRLTYEGAKVEMVVESMPYYMGLSKNVVECLYDNQIPLMLNTKVISVLGKERLTGVVIASLDKNGNIIEGTNKKVECDTLILSAGLVPENELTSRSGAELDTNSYGTAVDQYCQTSLTGVYASGNVLHTHDLADLVAKEAEKAGAAAAFYAKTGKWHDETLYKIIPTGNTKYTMPQYIRKTDEDITISLRLRQAKKKAYSKIICQGKVIAELNKKIMIHGEMEYITLKGKDITGDLTVESGGEDV